MHKLKFIFFAFVKLPSTLLHELLHATPVIIFMILDLFSNLIRSVIHVQNIPVIRITSFNLIPSFKDKSLGSVSYVNSSPIQSIIISIAPLFSWLLLIYIYQFLGYISINSMQLFMPNNSFIIHLSLLPITIYLIWSGTLSKQDIKNVFDGIMSVQFIVILLIIIGVYFSKDYGFGFVYDGVFEVFNYLKKAVKF